MNAMRDRWEHGSEFHWPPIAAEPTVEPPWRARRLVGSGRDALRLLAAFGKEARRWQRFWVPSYLCQEVVRAVADTGLELCLYADSPLRAEPSLPPLRRGDAILHVNYFGLRSGPSLQVPAGVDLVEDHTHDPISSWALESDADFCIASLRKTLPIPDGGVAWSPRAHALPEEPVVSPGHARAAADKLGAMLLKALYLDGREIDKEAFRRLALAGEAAIASGAISGMDDVTRALVPALPIGTWRRRRADNHALMAARLAGKQWAAVLQPARRGAVPFSAVVVFDTPARREKVRRALIESRIYPAVLWPLDQSVLAVPDEDRDLSRRVLSIHCDFRYAEADLVRVADRVAQAGES